MFRSTGRVARIVVTAAVAAGLFIAAPANASPAPAPAAPAPAAAAPAAPAGEGWLRLAHLSPDTMGVDVRITARTGGVALSKLNDLTYGGVSPYEPVPDGTYIVSMVPSGSKASARPMVSTSVKVENGKTSTVAVYGPNKSIAVKVFNDDLTAPTDGKARIRLIQASTRSSSVNVKTSTGVVVAAQAKRGTATGYAEVAAGAWTLDLTAASKRGSTSISLAQGSVTTLFVLDTASGGLTVQPVLDSASVGQDPVGGVQTGGGYLASHPLATVLTEIR